MAKMIFVNLPVTDLPRATAFYEAIGAVKNEQFCDGTASCMVFSETIYAMLLTHEKFMQFSPRKIADTKTSCEVLICVSADSRAEVDDIVGKAKPPVAASIRARSRITAPCMAAVSRIPMAISGK